MPCAQARWRGYDGAANVEVWTSGFVDWFDLGIELALPKADWVVAIEVRVLSLAFAMRVQENKYINSCCSVVHSTYDACRTSCIVRYGMR